MWIGHCHLCMEGYLKSFLCCHLRRWFKCRRNPGKWRVFDLKLLFNCSKCNYKILLYYWNIWRFDTFSLLPQESPWFIEELESKKWFFWKRKSSLYKRVNLLNHVWADTWCHWNMIISDFIGLLYAEKMFKLVSMQRYLTVPLEF